MAAGVRECGKAGDAVIDATKDAESTLHRGPSIGGSRSALGAKGAESGGRHNDGRRGHRVPGFPLVLRSDGSALRSPAALAVGVLWLWHFP